MTPEIFFFLLNYEHYIVLRKNGLQNLPNLGCVDGVEISNSHTKVNLNHARILNLEQVWRPNETVIMFVMGPFFYKN